MPSRLIRDAWRREGASGRRGEAERREVTRDAERRDAGTRRGETRGRGESETRRRGEERRGKWASGRRKKTLCVPASLLSASPLPPFAPSPHRGSRAVART